MADHNPAPWHHGIVVGLSLLFYLIGSVDFVVGASGLGVYLDWFSASQRAFVTGLPGWILAVWAVATLGGLFGSWLLRGRHRSAVLFLFLPVAAILFLILWLSIFSRPGLIAVLGFSGLYILAGTTAITFLIYSYARWERTHHYLT
ncbi:MAG: hypothetical protein ACK5IB_04605 [Qingshengfaniella sp.]